MEENKQINYIEPELEVIALNHVDVITSSVDNPWETEDDEF